MTPVAEAAMSVLKRLIEQRKREAEGQKDAAA